MKYKNNIDHSGPLRLIANWVILVFKCDEEVQYLLGDIIGRSRREDGYCDRFLLLWWIDCGSLMGIHLRERERRENRLLIQDGRAHGIVW